MFRLPHGEREEERKHTKKVYLLFLPCFSTISSAAGTLMWTLKLVIYELVNLCADFKSNWSADAVEKI